jgi:hypothetical protein
MKDILSIVLGFISIYLTTFAFAYSTLFAELKIKERKDTANWFEKKRFGTRYRWLLRVSLQWLEDWIGGKSAKPSKLDTRGRANYFFRSRVFYWWLPFSLIYPMVILIIEWVVSNQSGFAPNLDSPGIKETRWQIGTIYGLDFVAIWILFSIFRPKTNNSTAGSDAIRGIKPGFFASVLAIASAFYVDHTYSATAGAIAVGGAVTFVIAIAAISAIKGFKSYAASGALTYALFIIGAFWLFDKEATGAALIYVFCFNFILPLINSFFDFLSLGTSRWLLFNISQRETGFKTGWHTVLDFLFAAFCLIGLAAILPLVLQGFVKISGNEIFDMKGYIEIAKESPFSKGFGITGMLLTTFIPTFIHILIALFAWPAPNLPWRIRTIERLRNQEGVTAHGRIWDVFLVSSLIAIPFFIFFTILIILYKSGVLQTFLRVFIDFLFEIALSWLQLIQ